MRIKAIHDKYKQSETVVHLPKKRLTVTWVNTHEAQGNFPHFHYITAFNVKENLAVFQQRYIGSEPVNLGFAVNYKAH